MNDVQVEEMRQWAISVMKWERAIAFEHGKNIKRIKGGVKKLNESVQGLLTKKDRSTARRARDAAQTIKETVIETYGLKEER